MKYPEKDDPVIVSVGKHKLEGIFVGDSTLESGMVWVKFAPGVWPLPGGQHWQPLSFERCNVKLKEEK